MSIKLQLDIINNKLAKLPKELAKAKKDGDLKALRAMRKIVRQGTPKTKGKANLKKRHKKRYDGEEEKAGNLRAAIGEIKGLTRTNLKYLGVRAGKKYKKDGYYARFREYGTIHQPARPFWKKAVTPALSVGKNILIQAAKIGFSNYEIKNTVK